jgi:hypothetical protein
MMAIWGAFKKNLNLLRKSQSGLPLFSAEYSVTAVWYASILILNLKKVLYDVCCKQKQLFFSLAAKPQMSVHDLLCCRSAYPVKDISGHFFC